jgi:1-acyl-sn-glycerol-3-phosphate acyltransferase
VANHQSTYDIPPLIWYLRKHHPKFISKKELGKGIPSVSFNLRHGGALLIDRKNPKEAIQSIQEFGKRLTENKHSAVIFPEGTRSRDGKIKPFQKAGLFTLLKHMPDALVVPVSIGNSWRFAEHKYFPMPLGVPLKVKVHPALEIIPGENEKLFKTIETIVGKGVKTLQ